MNQGSLLTSRQFLPQFMTQFLGACNDNIFKNALIMLIVFKLSDALGLNAQLWVALASGVFMLPFFLFSITAGQLADKYCKSNLIIQLKFAEVLLMICAAIGLYSQNILWLMVTLFLLGVQATFFGPLKYAILPELLAKSALLRGNSLTGAGTFIAILIGTIIGGIFIMAPYGQTIISGILIVLALFGWLSAWCIPTTVYTNPTQAIHGNIFQEMGTLWKFASARKSLLLSIIGISWFWLFGSTLLSILPPFTKIILQGDEAVVTFFMAIFSIGIALGSLLYPQIAKAKLGKHAIYLSLLGLTLCTIDLGLSAHAHIEHSTLQNIHQFLSDPAHYRAVLDACGIAIFGGLYTVPLYTIIQIQTPDTHRAQVIALNNIMNALFMILGAVSLMGLTSIGCTIAQNLLVLAIGSSLVTGYLYLYRTDFRRS